MKHLSLTFLSLSLISLYMHAEAEENVLDARTLHRTMWAQYKLAGGDHQQAGKWYDTLLSTAQLPPASYKGMLKFLYETGQFGEILRLMPKLEQQFEDDPAIQLLFAQTLEKAGQKREAHERIIKLNTKYKTNQELALYAANIYTARQELGNALIVIDNFLNSSPRKPNNFVFHFLQAQIYTNMNKKKEALASVKKCLEIQPAFDRGWLLQALLEEQANNLDAAIKGYTNFLDLTDRNKEVEDHLLTLMFKAKALQQGSTMLTLNKACYLKALVFFERKLYQQALEQIEACLKEKPDKEGQLLKIQILTSMKQFDAASTVLQAWIRTKPQEALWYKTLHLLCRIGLPYKRAIALLQEVAKEHPKALNPELYLADLCTRADKPKEALKHYQKALTLTSDSLTKTKLLFHMGLLNYELNKFDDAKKYLEEGLALKTDFAPLLNLLAYYYASKENNTAKAAPLIAHALKLDTNNPHFLDTHAYVLYRNKEYDKALAIFQTVQAQLPNDTTVLKHLAKTLYEKGNVPEARANVERALTLAHNDHDKKTCTTLLKRWGSSSDEKEITR